MQMVEIERDVAELMDLYHDLYRQRYATVPVIQNNAEANTIIRDIRRTAGMARARTLVTQFMKMDGDNGWFLRQGHSLQVFKKNLDQVNAATGQRAAPREAIRMKMPLACDKCGQYFDWIGTPEELERRRLCSKCHGR